MRRFAVQVEAGREGSDGKPSVGPVYRNIFCKDGFPPPVPGIETCWDIFSVSAKRNPTARMLGHREIIDGKAGKYVWQTYEEVYEQVTHIGAAMRACGIEPHARCGIYGSNCPEWVVAMEACNGHSVICVPLYDTLGANSVNFIIDHAEINIVFVQDTKVSNLLKCLENGIGHVNTSVCFTNFTSEQKEVADSLGITTFSWHQFLELDPNLLGDDLMELKPTVFAGVPRVFDRVYAGAMKTVNENNLIRRAVFNVLYNYKLAWMKLGFKQREASPLADLIAFNKVKAKLGGHIRLIMSGAAPLSCVVEEFLRVTTCAYVLQGYGLTETCGWTSACFPDEMLMFGTVGPPGPYTELRLEAVPEMGYDPLAHVPRGEICCRGKTMFSGYFKRDDLTQEVFRDGWFHTGDIGELQTDGILKIIDRKKNLFKLSQGEYIAVEHLENVYGQCSCIDGIWIYGNSFESTLVGVVIPNQVHAESWAKVNGLKGAFTELCSHAEFKTFILEQLIAVAKKNNLRGFEYIKAIHLDPQPFDIERDLITPTYKKKRAQLLKYYQENINNMYRDLKKKAAGYIY